MSGATKESEGICALAARDFSAAAPLFAEAAERWSTMMVRAELRCRWAQAFSVREAGDRDQSVAMLLALEERVTEAGLIPLLGLVHRSMRQVGIERRATRSPSRRAPDPPLTPRESLTPREERVLALVGDGLPSAEISSRLGLSATTVDDTIESARGKLGARTRIQAAVMARTSPSTEPQP